MQHRLTQLRNQRGFTLLELLIVVAILAIIAGGLVVAYEGIEEQAKNKEQSHAMAALDDSLRVFTAISGNGPNDMDSLIAVTGVTSLLDYGSDGTLSGGSFPSPLTGAEPVEILNEEIRDEKLIVTVVSTTSTTLNDQHLDALREAGIRAARYIDAKGNTMTAAHTESSGNPGTCTDAPGGITLTIPAQDGTTARVGCIDTADIPNRIFDFPREGSGRNRGRGFSHELVLQDPLMLWAPGPGGINLSKVGANPGGMVGQNISDYTTNTALSNSADRLVAFGIGNNTSLFNVDSGASQAGVEITSAPTYPNVPRYQYSRYVALYNVGSVTDPLEKAALQAIVDPKGDFLDEELAEASGQKG